MIDSFVPAVAILAAVIALYLLTRPKPALQRLPLLMTTATPIPQEDVHHAVFECSRELSSQLQDYLAPFQSSQVVADPTKDHTLELDDLDPFQSEPVGGDLAKNYILGYCPPYSNDNRWSLSVDRIQIGWITYFAFYYAPRPFDSEWNEVESVHRFELSEDDGFIARESWSRSGISEDPLPAISPSDTFTPGQIMGPDPVRPEPPTPKMGLMQ